MADAGKPLLALLTIRDQRLYREGFKTFNAYCAEKWGMSKTHANCLIGGSKTVENLTACAVKPTCEYQLRPLASLEPAQQCEVWEEVFALPIFFGKKD